MNAFARRVLGLATCLVLVAGCSCRTPDRTPSPTPDAPTPASGAGPVELKPTERTLSLKKRPTFADPSAPTEAEMDALAQWLIPQVEEAGGAQFSKPLKGRLGTTENLAKEIASESREIMGRIYDLPPSVIESMSDERAGVIPGLLGKYMTSTGDVYVVPHSVAQMGEGLAAAMPEHKDNATLEVATLIMAHELGHALQDQVADLDGTFEGLKDLDHFDGMRGITEGQANWITLRVAKAIDREDVFWHISKGQGWGKEGLENPGAFDIWMLYGQGMAFCDHHAKTGGTEQLWQMVKHPPRSTTQLFRPERYSPTGSQPFDLAGVLGGVEIALTRSEDWVVADTNLGEAPLRRETLGLDKDRVDAVLDAMKWGHERRMYIGRSPTTSPRNASALVIEFDDKEQAVALVELLSDGLKTQADARTALEKSMSESIPGVLARRWEVEARPYDRVSGDAVLRRVVGPVTETGARLAVEEEQSLWVVRDRRLVVLTVSGFRPGNRLDKAVDLLFLQLDASDQKTPTPAP
ncbi:MAG: hypothetical protein AB8H79_24305 [Myxococcota bacterium]